MPVSLESVRRAFVSLVDTWPTRDSTMVGHLSPSHYTRGGKNVELEGATRDIRSNVGRFTSDDFL